MTLLLEAIAYARAGFPVFPCHSIVDDKCSCGNPECGSPGKHPRTPRGSLDATVQVDQINEWWRRWPDASIAMATGSASDVFVVDIDRRADRDGFLWYEAMDLPHAPKATTPSGGIHLFFSVPEGVTIANSSDSVHRGVDIRGDGGYVIAAPSMGANGSEYVWDDDIREFDPAEPPSWLLEQISSSADRVRLPGAQRWRISELLDENKREEIRDALRYIDASQRDVWLRVGMAIHSRFANEDGFDLWDEWSQTTSQGNYNARDQRYTWDRFDSYGGVEISTLFYMAMSAGWEQPTDAPPADDEVEAWVNADDDDSFPMRLIDDADGLMGEIIKWMDKTSHRRAPVLSFAATLTLMGTIYGRRYQTRTGLRTNLYTLGVAPPGYGKEHARQCCKRLLQRSGAMDLLGGEDIASAPGMMKALAQRPVQLFLLDEFGEILKKIASNRAASWERDLSSLLLRLYSSAGTTMRGREVAHQSRVDVNQPHACLYGTSTPLMYDSIGSGAIAGGLMSRILVFHVDGRRGERQEVAAKDPPPELVEALQLHMMGGDAGTGSGMNLGFLPMGTPDVETVDETAACADVWCELEQVADERIMGRDGDLWARLEEHAKRLALIRALSKSSPMIDATDARWGAAVAMWCLSRAAKVVEERVADTVSEANTKAVLLKIRKRGVNGISRSELTKSLYRLGKRQREEAIATLMESHAIIEKIEGKSRRYYAVRSRREAAS